MNLEKIQKLNPEIKIYHISDPCFKTYGRVLDSKPFLSYFTYLDQHTRVPETKNQYVAHDEDLKNFLDNLSIFKRIYPGLHLQFGYVNGHNTKLNALEYHHSNEINIALTPLVLFLGSTKNINQLTFHTENLKAFYVPENTVIEILDTTLHFSPCKVDDLGFKCGVVLPYGTNMEFVKLENKKTDEDHMLFKTNKWLLAHPENTTAIDLGAIVGIIGPNLEIQYK
jgi:hypothetical protein